MITQNAFRAIVLSSIAAAIVGAIVGILAESSLPHELQSFLQSQEAAPLQPRDILAWVILAPTLVLGLIAAIGFCLFWRPSRTIAVIATVMIMLAQPLLQPLVVTGIELSFADASSMLWGAAVALSFCAPIRAHFDKVSRDT